MWPASIATEIGPTVALADWRPASLPCGVMSMYPVKMQACCYLFPFVVQLVFQPENFGRRKSFCSVFVTHLKTPGTQIMVPLEKFLHWNTELIKSEIEKLSAPPFWYKGGTLVKSFVFHLFLAFSFQIYPRLFSIKNGSVLSESLVPP